MSADRQFDIQRDLGHHLVNYDLNNFSHLVKVAGQVSVGSMDLAFGQSMLNIIELGFFEKRGLVVEISRNNQN